MAGSSFVAARSRSLTKSFALPVSPDDFLALIDGRRSGLHVPALTQFGPGALAGPAGRAPRV
jgi:hypothetical protein